MKFKQILYFNFLLVALFIQLLSGCSVTGKYYSKQNQRLHEWIELDRDSTSIISKWAEIRYNSEGTWSVNGDTINVQGYEFIRTGRKLVNLNSGKTWKKQLIIFPRDRR